MPIESSIIDYEKPPVTEVACSAVFEELNLAVPHIGLLWADWHDELPMCQELPPQRHYIEQLCERKSQIMEVSDRLPLPRMVFANADQSHTLQLQRDYLMYAWTKVHPDAEYPRFDAVFNQFEAYLNNLKLFAEQTESGVLTPLQYELKYVNQIPRGDGWMTPGDIHEVLPQFDSAKASGKFLPQPSGLHLQWVYELPDQSGRLYVRVSTVPNSQILQFSLTCRGIRHNKQLKGFKEWFEQSRSWIVHGFRDLTDPAVQKVCWKRRD